MTTTYFPEHLIRYMIDRHPGDPFREQTNPNQHFLLAYVVRYSAPYSLEFVKYVLDQNPDAAKVTKKSYYQTTVLHEACLGSKPRPEIVRLVLDAYPAAAFAAAGRYSEMPLSNLLQYSEHQAEQKTFGIVVRANPKAIFALGMHNIYDRYPSSAFSNLSDTVLDRRKQDETIRKRAWKLIHFMLNVYRLGNSMHESVAWNPPKHIVHAGKIFLSV